MVKRGYAGEVDGFAVWCPQKGKGYYLPIADVASGIGTLRVEPPANGQRRGVRWAADYELGDGVTAAGESRGRDSNPCEPFYKNGALPTELPRRVVPPESKPRR